MALAALPASGCHCQLSELRVKSHVSGSPLAAAGFLRLGTRCPEGVTGVDR
jgi:hypothetical protein